MKKSNIQINFKDLCMFHCYLQRWYINMWILFVIAPVISFLAFVGFAIYLGGMPIVTIIAVFISMSLLLSVWPLQILYQSYLMQNYIKKSGNSNFFYLELDEEKVTITTESIKSEIKWDYFKKVVELKEIFIIWHSTNEAIIIPKRDIDDIVVFKSILKEHLKDKVKFTKDSN